MGRVWMRLLTPAAAAAALLVLTIGVPANAAGPLVGDDGVARSGTYTADVVPAWKARLLVLHGMQQAGTMSAADAAEWNAIIDAQGIDPTSRFTDATASPSGSITPMANYTSNDLTGTQKPQLRGNWCGPASAQSIVLAWHNEKSWPTSSALNGQSLSQAALATATYTNAGSLGGTDWVDHDMTRALNNWLVAGGGSLYVQYTPTSVTLLQNHVTIDIDIDYMIASDMSEVINGSHYNYHPNQPIYHWTTIRGYASSGATLHFQDPAANTTVLGTAWANVAPYFSMSSASTYSFMTHNVTRGIAW